ncbi:hypothetical protein CYY_003426 [Polysphondylium violaceum]|uniref:Uncharacterized protein n=1 Tax=Polysphondylium violaceum TaxID=133409 RepID=A0A8J4PZI4_9MYCE|nr:hypothetical protein CYY_003426 [Polysphondylium violaceum]
MVYFKISFQSEDPFPLQAPYGFDSEFYFEFKIQFLILDINDIKSKNSCKYQTLYIRNDDEIRPKINESFIDGVRNINFQVSNLILFFYSNLSNWISSFSLISKKTKKFADTLLELRPLIESGNVGFYNICERSNIKSTLQKEENSNHMKRPFYGF